MVILTMQLAGSVQVRASETLVLLGGVLHMCGLHTCGLHTHGLHITLRHCGRKAACVGKYVCLFCGKGLHQ